MVAPTRLGLSPKRANASRITEGRFGKSRCGYHLSRPTDSPYDRLAGPSREALVDDRLVPVARNIEPLVDQRLKLRLGEVARVNAHWFMDPADACGKLEACRRDHNEVRPHNAMGYNVPIDPHIPSGAARPRD